VAGRAPVELAADRIDALADDPRAGAPLTALLADANIDVSTITHLALRSADGDRLELPVASLRTAGERVALRHNRRGTLRLSHTVGGGERDHRSEVVAIEIQLGP
jgi:hypothetical protein